MWTATGAYQKIVVFALELPRFSSHDAQPCYCGEANCVGFIGGKTQTDIVTMDDLVLDGMFSLWSHDRSTDILKI